MLVNIHTHLTTDLTFEIVNLQELEPVAYPFSAGIHPKDVQTGRDKVRLVASLLHHPCCLAVGEAGLDKIIGVPMEIQRSVFEAQIRLSENASLPLILHCVKAWNEVLAVKKELQPHQPWIFHGFRKTALLASVLDAGLMISIGTAALYDPKLQEIIPQIPDDRLLLETDDDARHTIEEVYLKVAGLKALSLESLREKIFANFRRTFSKWQPD